MSEHTAIFLFFAAMSAFGGWIFTQLPKRYPQQDGAESEPMASALSMVFFGGSAVFALLGVLA